jgi:hypothetical protein
MKSNTNHIVTTRVQNMEDVRSILKKEKETLVSMFLANATLVELSAQFKLIDELHGQLSDQTAV